MIISLGADRYAECLQVLQAGFATAVAAYGITAQNTPSNPAFWAAGAIDRVVAGGCELFGEEASERLVGCAFVGPSREPLARSLRHLAVLPSERHRGIGARLVEEAAERARAGGARTLTIGVVAQNRSLTQWYHRLGFVTTASGISHPGLVFTVDYLERRL